MGGGDSDGLIVAAPDDRRAWNIGGGTTARETWSARRQTHPSVTRSTTHELGPRGEIRRQCLL
jgi:hypothetical protein